MNLLDQARIDVQNILSGAFSTDITFTSPDSQTVTVKGIHAKHHLGINPATGNAISSKKASVSVSEQEIIDVNPNYPVRCKDEVTFKNHIIEVKDSTGRSKRYKADHWFPDETVGLITIILEKYAD
jgi:hypothetical protein